ncbi:MAG: MerR family transcriptional regulator [Candidatus Omnitrophota bacterium]
MGKPISAKNIVKKFNLAYHTLNYYTTIGLLTVVKKGGGVRLYDEAVVSETLKKIEAMMLEGYTLRLIRSKLSGK